jgi:ubiquitin carboxyl-terminal hydrolase 34
MQSWTQRQCSCCFRDPKNFERFNWAIQVLILVVVEIVKHLRDPEASQNKPENLEAASGSSNKDTGDNEAVVPKHDIVLESMEDEDSNGERPSLAQERPLWDVDDKDKLIYFVAKVFLNSFPTYVAYKQHMQVKNEEITPQEIQALSQFCEINEPEASPYLFRNVTLFCKVKGMEALGESIYGQSPESMPLHQVNILVTLAANVKSWMNFQSILKYYVPFRSNVLGYMCKLVDTELKTVSARNMAGKDFNRDLQESVWFVLFV